MIYNVNVDKGIIDDFMNIHTKLYIILKSRIDCYEKEKMFISSII